MKQNPITLSMKALNIEPIDIINNAPCSTNLLALTEHGQEALAIHFANLLSKGHVPVVEVPEWHLRRMIEASEQIYGALVDSLSYLFTEYYSQIPELFQLDSDQYADFIAYARHTYENNHEALYGRFDVIYDATGDHQPKIIEFNGDTPVMLFESTVIQNLVAKRAGREMDQCNYYHENLVGSLKRLRLRGKKVLCLSNFQAIEDTLTAETLFHCLNDSGECSVSLQPLEKLRYEPLFINEGRSPFTVDGSPFDAIFMLHPWEEMLEASPDILREWRTWTSYVRFFEPAWRWFISNKSSMAWLHRLLKEQPHSGWANLYGDAIRKHLPKTYLYEGEQSCESYFGGSGCFIKPTIGRLSSNIRYLNPVVGQDYRTDGPYEDSPCVVQEEVEHRCFTGTSLAPLYGIWMAPYSDTNEPTVMEGSCLSVRLSDWSLEGEHAEEFAPHIIGE